MSNQPFLSSRRKNLATKISMTKAKNSTAICLLDHDDIHTHTQWQMEGGSGDENLRELTPCGGKWLMCINIFLASFIKWRSLSTTWIKKDIRRRIEWKNRWSGVHEIRTVYDEHINYLFSSLFRTKRAPGSYITNVNWTVFVCLFYFLGDVLNGRVVGTYGTFV